MPLAVKNDIAQIMQHDGKIVITPKDGLHVGEFGKYDMTMMLALYSSILRDKMRGNE